ncbi:MAG: DUF1461 domain-containing protein, partial [Clostridia bacterium]|nr:DUF1461 domain-containing protein [Clostridia bacterium]
LSAVLLLFALLVGAILRIFTDKDWVEKEYERIDIEAQSGYSVKDAAYVLGRMMDYSVGSFDELDKVSVSENGETVVFFNESELNHMVDVRVLTTSVLKLGLAALIVGFALFALAFVLLRLAGLKTFAKAFLIALGVLIVIIAALGIWMAVDFDSFWRMFHVVFLDLESSTFDPAVSRMIRICPAELFSDFIMHFALIAGLGLILPVGMSVFFLCVKRQGGRLLPFILISAGLCAWLARLLTGNGVFLIVSTALLICGVIVTAVLRAKQTRAELIAKREKEAVNG